MTGKIWIVTAMLAVFPNDYFQENFVILTVESNVNGRILRIKLTKNAFQELHLGQLLCMQDLTQYYPG